MARRLSAKAMAAVATQAATPFQREGAPPPTVRPVPVAELVRHPRNARAIPPTAEQTKALQASVRATGVLVPILVSPIEDGKLGVVAGWQRASAARAVGLTTVPAIEIPPDEAMADRVSLVENALRADMHPVDQWRSLQTLMDGGATLAAATATLGLSDRVARQMHLLSQMHPSLLAEMAKGDVPGMWLLREIARADSARQAEALKTATHKQGKGTRIDWNTVSAMCKQTRIPRAYAIFDHAASPVVFEQDLFAEAGHQDEWTTTDIDGFREQQRAALDRLVAGHDRAAVHDYLAGSYRPDVPRSWIQLRWFHDFPKAVPELAADEHFVVAMKPDAQVVAYVFRQDPARPGAQGASGHQGAAAAGDSAPPRLLTDAGLQLAATMKHQALQDALQHLRSNPSLENPAILLRVLLEALGAMNVTPGGADKHAAGEAIAAATPDGGEPHPTELVRIACETIAAMLIFPAPKIMSSGPVADDIARSLGAELFLPRFDTADFLAQCSGTMLRQAAQLVQLQPGQKLPKSVGALRDFLVGKLPNWKPVTFYREGTGHA